RSKCDWSSDVCSSDLGGAFWSPKWPDPEAPCMPCSTAVLRPLGTTSCQRSSPIAGSFHALCSTPSIRRSELNFDHSPLVACESLATSSHGGLCCDSTHRCNGRTSGSSSCCCLHSPTLTICSSRQSTISARRTAFSCCCCCSSSHSSFSHLSLCSP